MRQTRCCVHIVAKQAKLKIIHINFQKTGESDNATTDWNSRRGSRILAVFSKGDYKSRCCSCQNETHRQHTNTNSNMLQTRKCNDGMFCWKLGLDIITGSSCLVSSFEKKKQLMSLIGLFPVERQQLIYWNGQDSLLRPQQLVLLRPQVLWTDGQPNAPALTKQNH